MPPFGTSRSRCPSGHPPRLRSSGAPSSRPAFTTARHCLAPVVLPIRSTPQLRLSLKTLPLTFLVLGRPLRPKLEAPPPHRDPASAAVPPRTAAPPPHFRAAPAGALGPGLQGSGLRLPAQGSACGRCGRCRCRRRRRSLLGSVWSLFPERVGESEQRVLAALCGLPRAASGPRVAEPPPPPPRWGPPRAAPPPWPAR